MFSPDFFAQEPESPRVAPQTIFSAGMRHHHLANTAYPIGHNCTFAALREARSSHEKLLKSSLAHADRLGLYLHIPFCERRCAYCEYTVLESVEPSIQSTYTTRG